jgi:hypothetical protein
MLDAATKRRFEDALSSGKLRGLAEQMTAEGLSHVAIYHRFDSFRRFLDEVKREADEDALGDSLDCIIGFCSPAYKWFDHYLTNEEINHYGKTNAGG